jgi:hypothetical protein
MLEAPTEQPVSLGLPDLFSLDLPKEGQNGKGWCFVVVMDQGEHLSPPLLRFNDACILMLTTLLFL